MTVIEEIRLSQQDAVMLIKLLENPIPNQALSSAMRRYQKKVNDGAVIIAPDRAQDRINGSTASFE